MRPNEQKKGCEKNVGLRTFRSPAKPSVPRNFLFHSTQSFGPFGIFVSFAFVNALETSNDDGLFVSRFDVAMLVGDFGWEGDRGFEVDITMY